MGEGWGKLLHILVVLDGDCDCIHVYTMDGEPYKKPMFTLLGKESCWTFFFLHHKRSAAGRIAKGRGGRPASPLPERRKRIDAQQTDKKRNTGPTKKSFGF